MRSQDMLYDVRRLCHHGGGVALKASGQLTAVGGGVDLSASTMAQARITLDDFEAKVGISVVKPMALTINASFSFAEALELAL
jgi:hypothetical protein